MEVHGRVDRCPFCNSHNSLVENDDITCCSACGEYFRIKLSPVDLDMFKLASSINDKPFRASGKPFKVGVGRQPKPLPFKCATSDCNFRAMVEQDSIFCASCDTEYYRSAGTASRSIVSGSPTAEITRRRKAIEDHKRNIGKAIL